MPLGPRQPASGQRAALALALRGADDGGAGAVADGPALRQRLRGLRLRRSVGARRTRAFVQGGRVGLSAPRSVQWADGGRVMGPCG